MPVTRRPVIESDSVLDSLPEQAWKALQRFIGADDPSQVMIDPLMAVGKAAGPARRVLRTPGAVGGDRIAKGTQSSMGLENKIPRFRSPHGTFIKHEGEWWRIGKQ